MKHLSYEFARTGVLMIGILRFFFLLSFPFTLLLEERSDSHPFLFLPVRGGTRVHIVDKHGSHARTTYITIGESFIISTKISYSA